jgi:MOSC domain-containing protein YiiM
MREVPLPPPGVPPLQRSVVAVIAAILELDDPGDVPIPAADHPAPWTVWRNWLAGRGLGLVPVHAPATFNWPGPWLALLPAGDGDEGGEVAVVAFGSPPGLVWSPLPGAQTFDTVRSGYVIAPADPASWARTTAPTIAHDRTTGRVELLALAGAAQAPMTVVEQVTAHAGRGLEGDRYCDARGTFSDPHATGHDLTLIEAEVLEQLRLPEAGLAAPDARRNVVTRGIDLNALVGQRFTIGAVTCVGRRLCEPCAHLQRLTVPGTLRALVHRGGLRADIVTGGLIRVGDTVTPVPVPPVPLEH